MRRDHPAGPGLLGLQSPPGPLVCPETEGAFQVCTPGPALLGDGAWPLPPPACRHQSSLWEGGAPSAAPLLANVLLALHRPCHMPQRMQTPDGAGDEAGAPVVPEPRVLGTPPSCLAPRCHSQAGPSLSASHAWDSSFTVTVTGGGLHPAGPWGQSQQPPQTGSSSLLVMRTSYCPSTLAIGESPPATGNVSPEKS